ncbi:MAG: endonuclease/exonuclease/phosphatase family protein [Pirellulaceae bacterium]|nr:endonuclease/exonuclease/phosphatase family protein [Pirellulaceae bacterium]
MSDATADQATTVAKEQRPSRLLPIWRMIRVLGFISAVASIISLFAAYHWVADMLTHLTVQYFVLMAPAAILLWRQKRPVLCVLLLGLMGWHASKISPYVLPNNAQTAKTAATKVYRLAVFNVLRTNERFSETLDELLSCDADIVYLMEVQPAWKAHLERVRTQYPYQEVVADLDYLGVALLSKIPWRDLEIVQLGYVSNPTYDVRLCVGDEPNDHIHLIATHPLPPFGEVLTAARDTQLSTLSARLVDNEPQIFCGDFNLSPWSPRFQALCQTSSLSDAALGYGLAPTLIPLPTVLGGVKVDHVLKNSRIHVQQYQVKRSSFSDHGIVLFDFSVGPGQ